MSSSDEEVAEEKPVYSIGQMRRVSALYELLARLLPTEGRDFSVEITFPDKDDSSKMSVRFKDHTKIGKIWCAYCSDILKAQNK